MAELWYFTRDGQAQDPLTKEELAQLAGCGLLKPTDLVWTEGMPQWVRAGSAGGLFAEEALIGRGGQAQRRSDVYDLEPEPPVKGRPQEDYQDDYYRTDDDPEDRDRPSRRKRGIAKAAVGAGALVAAGGLSPGAKAAAIGGSVITLLLIVGIVLLIVLGGGGNTRSFSLAAPQRGPDGRIASPRQDIHISFKAGNKVEIWVKSTGQSDVDLYVYDANNRRVEFDDGDSSDCYVCFRAAKSQAYRMELRNEYRDDQQWRNGANSGTLSFKEGPPAPGENLVEYTTRLPWFENPAVRRPGFNPRLGGPFNPPAFNPPAFQPPQGIKGPGIPPPNRPNRPFNPGFPNNNPNRRP
jgi:hypothetical protein